jgi:Transcription factor WhiB
VSLAVTDRGRWEDWAACRGKTGFFFSTDEFTRQLCVRICSTCPVLEECSDAHPDCDYFGVVAGRLPTRWPG